MLVRHVKLSNDNPKINNLIYIPCNSPAILEFSPDFPWTPRVDRAGPLVRGHGRAGSGVGLVGVRVEAWRGRVGAESGSGWGVDQGAVGVGSGSGQGVGQGQAGVRGSGQGGGRDRGRGPGVTGWGTD